MARQVRRDYSPFLFPIMLVIVALVAGRSTFLRARATKLASDASATRPKIVETATFNMPADASEEAIAETTGRQIVELADEEDPVLPQAPTDTKESLATAIEGQPIEEDTPVARDARLALTTLRTQIKLYREQHHGVNPRSTLVDLTQCTDSKGEAGPGFPFGPYLPELPENPLAKSSAVKPITSDPADEEDLTPGGGGWLYNARTGNIWLDYPGYLAQ